MKSLGLIEIVILAVALGTDAFSVATALGVEQLRSWEKFRLAASFGLFQFAMPIVGVLGGYAAKQLVGLTSFVGGLLLILIGAHMIYRAVRVLERPKAFDCRTPIGLLLLSLSVSTDALAVGFSLGVTSAALLLATATIGIITFLMSFLGVELGRRIGRLVGDRAELVGGVVLVFIGLRLAV